MQTPFEFLSAKFGLHQPIMNDGYFVTKIDKVTASPLSFDYEINGFGDMIGRVIRGNVATISLPGESDVYNLSQGYVGQKLDIYNGIPYESVMTFFATGILPY